MLLHQQCSTVVHVVLHNCGASSTVHPVVMNPRAICKGAPNVMTRSRVRRLPPRTDAGFLPALAFRLYPAVGCMRLCQSCCCRCTVNKIWQGLTARIRRSHGAATHSSSAHCMASLPPASLGKDPGGGVKGWFVSDSFPHGLQPLTTTHPCHWKP
jgi:hypothetical protein